MVLGPLVACGCEGEDKPGAKPPAVAANPTPAETAASDPLADDEARSRRYEAIAGALEADPKAAVAGQRFERARSDLQAIVDRGQDRHLKINAAVLLGHILELRGDLPGAIAYWRHATKLVPADAGPDDAGPFMALAVGLAADRKFEEAAKIQTQAAALDPNNLENWLALGELRLKAGDREGAATAYVDYERVRKSLIDGLTARNKDGGAYFVGPPERIACARSLSAAVDSGTALALLYALQTEDDPTVRQAIVAVMGAQRLEAYKPRLTALLRTENDADTKTTIGWALAQIEGDPVVIEPGQVPGVPPAESQGAAAPKK